MELHLCIMQLLVALTSVARSSSKGTVALILLGINHDTSGALINVRDCEGTTPFMKAGKLVRHAI